LTAEEGRFDMKVVITGGGGFLGRKLAKRLLASDGLVAPSGKRQSVDRLVLFDAVPFSWNDGDRRIEIVTGDVADRGGMRRLIDAETASVFHLAAVVSAGAEADFDLGYRVNLDGTLAVLEACRALPRPPRLIFASSVASFGGDFTGRVDDATPQTPQSSYGTQKAIGELLVNDYSRKGFVDGRSLRLPTIVVRPGKPNKAASSFASSIVREPLQGQTAVCPVDRETRLAVLSPRQAIESFLRAHDLPASSFGNYRSIMLPALTTTVGGLVEAVRRVVGEEPTRRIEWRKDPAIERIVASWPGELGWHKAKQLGFQADASVEAIVQAFIDDDFGQPG
jgi:nucleoside-diphosphate-sugar epimerase